jgi:ribosomal protein S18 acetylase RimI-like enzyme
MSRTVAIRAARPEDADQVVRTYEWLFAPPGMRPANWEERRAAAAFGRVISSEGAVVLVAQDDEELVGMCSVYLDIESIRFGQRAWVEDLAVHPRHRSRGIGKLLLDEAKAWARARGATHLELDSAETRVDAHRFYERERPTWRSMSFGWEL